MKLNHKITVIISYIVYTYCIFIRLPPSKRTLVYDTKNKAVSNERIVNATSSKSHLPCRNSIGPVKDPTHNLKVKIQRFIVNRHITPGTEIDAKDNCTEVTLAKLLEKKSIEEVVKQLFDKDDYKNYFNQENAHNRLSLAESGKPNTLLSIKEEYQNIYTSGNVKTPLNIKGVNPLDRSKDKKLSEEILDAHLEKDIKDIIPPVNTETPANVNKSIEKERQRQLSFRPDVKVFENENGDTPLHPKTDDTVLIRDNKHSRVSSSHSLRPENIREDLIEDEDVVTLPHKLTEREMGEKSEWRRQCGCLKTSDKLKQLLKRFPSPPPPPPPTPSPFSTKFEPSTCISAYCANSGHSCDTLKTNSIPDAISEKRKSSSSYKQAIATNFWHASHYLVSLLQLSVTTTALALYYIIYFYMQMIYYMLLSAMFFHNADGPMKITIAVVAVTSIIVGFNLLIRMERMVGFTLNE